MTRKTFLHDAVEFASLGAQSLEKDIFTECFRSNKQFKDYNMSIIILSFFIRYFIWLPIKVSIFLIAFTILSIFFIIVNWFNLACFVDWIFFFYMKLFAFVLGIRARHFGIKKKMSEPCIYVCNHTSFLDFIVLSSYKFHHAVISENHGGLFGFLFKFIISKNGSICFKRSDKKDKSTIKQRIYNHIKKCKAPMLIFPEGTCVNNKHTVLFQKGAFELDTFIVPVALKYKKLLMDPYWNRRKHNFVSHIFYLITRWRIDVEVHWTSPVKLNMGENPTAFSHRVKKLISEKADLINTPWNGYFKSQLIHAEHDLFKLALHSVYSKIKNGNFSFQYKNSADKVEYLNNYKIEIVEKDEVLFFNEMSKKQFFNECCNEFLRLKLLPLKKREIIIEKMSLKKRVCLSGKQSVICTCPTKND